MPVAPELVSDPDQPQRFASHHLGRDLGWMAWTRLRQTTHGTANELARQQMQDSLVVPGHSGIVAQTRKNPLTPRGERVNWRP